VTEVLVTEVGPRDGLQNEKALIPTEAKIAFVDGLTAAGHRQIEVSSFVRPDRVPALADAEDVFRGIIRRPGVRYVGLVANQRGLERAQGVDCDTIAVFTATSKAFTLSNIGMNVQDSLSRYAALTRAAHAGGLGVRGYVSTVFACPHDGPTRPEDVLRVVEALLAMGCYEVSLGDTTGVGTPTQVRRLLDTLVPRLGADQIALHLHDTWGMAIANALTTLEYGVRRFDASAGGLGGCPFARGASGNLATEDLLHLLHESGFETGVDLRMVASAASRLADSLPHPLYSRVHAALRAQDDEFGGTSC